MLLLSALGALPQIRAAADELDRHDPCPADAVSWFEEGPSRFRLEAYAATEQDADSIRAIIGAAAPELHVNCEEIVDADWVAMSLDGLPPVHAGRFIVAGAHALGAIYGGKKKIWIEASEAFGTGHHGTTWGCLMALEGVLRQRRIHRALDVGAGSAVLSIAAAKAGAHAQAIEIDRRAADIGAINIKQNKVQHRTRMRAADGGKAARSGYDLVFANILMRPLIRLAPLLTRATAPGGTLILSGLLQQQEPLVRLAYESRGMILQRRIRREAWSALVFRRPRVRVQTH